MTDISASAQKPTIDGNQSPPLDKTASQDIEQPSKHDSKQDSATPASARVFDTYELVEMIIAELPLKDILINAQATCRTFRDIITRSKKIQRSMSCYHVQDNGAAAVSPFRHYIDFDNSVTFPGQPHFFCEVSPCHMTSDRIEYRLEDEMIGSCKNSKEITPKKGGEESWRRVPLVFPRTAMHVELEKPNPTAGYYRTIKEDLQPGATLGDVYDWMCKAAFTDQTK